MNGLCQGTTLVVPISFPLTSVILSEVRERSDGTQSKDPYSATNASVNSLGTKSEDGCLSVSTTLRQP